MEGATASTKPDGAAGPLSHHGGQRAAARARFPDAPVPLVDLSTGINPVPYPLPPLDPALFADLPDPAALAELEVVAARAYGVGDPSMVVAAPGTQVLIDLLPRLIAPTSVAVLGPTYGEHGPGWARAGHQLRGVTRLQDLDGAKIAVLVNPNNPDGRIVGALDLLGLAARRNAAGGLLVVDEAFADLEAGVSLAGHLPRPGLVLLRSFGKTFGLAGLRLGFALGDPEIIAEIRAGLGPWAISGPAIAIGRQALAEVAWLEAARQRTALDAERLDRLMAGAGLVPVGGCRLFRLYQSPDAAKWFERLGKAGILTRPFDYRPDWLRLGLPGDQAAWDRLAQALS